MLVNSLLLPRRLLRENVRDFRSSRDVRNDDLAGNFVENIPRVPEIVRLSWYVTSRRDAKLDVRLAGSCCCSRVPFNVSTDVNACPPYAPELFTPFHHRDDAFYRRWQN